MMTLKDFGISLYIPSTGRADAVTVEKIFYEDDIVFVVRESEKESYKRYRCVVYPDNEINRKFTHQTSILCSNFFPFNMPNTSVSQVPKVSLYFGYVNLASTNVHNGQLRFRLIVEVRNRLDAFEHIE